MLDHYDDVMMSAMASQITSLTIVYSMVFSDADQRKHQSSASLAFVRGIHLWPVNSPHKGPVTLKMFPFGDVIMLRCIMGFKLPKLKKIYEIIWNGTAINLLQITVLNWAEKTENKCAHMINNTCTKHHTEQGHGLVGLRACYSS